MQYGLPGIEFKPGPVIGLRVVRRLCAACTPRPRVDLAATECWFCDRPACTVGRPAVGHSGVVTSRPVPSCLLAVGLLVAGCGADRGPRAASTTAKLTHAVTMSGDLAAFADTDGGAVFIERVDPQLGRVARIDAPGKPYGLAYDAARVLGDVPTVRQPNSVAVEALSGSVLVTASDPDGSSSVQIITSDLLPPR